MASHPLNGHEYPICFEYEVGARVDDDVRVVALVVEVDGCTGLRGGDGDGNIIFASIQPPVVMLGPTHGGVRPDILATPIVEG